MNFCVERGWLEALCKNNASALPAIPPPMMRICRMDLSEDIAVAIMKGKDRICALFMLYSDRRDVGVGALGTIKITVYDVRVRGDLKISTSRISAKSSAWR